MSLMAFCFSKGELCSLLWDLFVFSNYIIATRQPFDTVHDMMCLFCFVLMWPVCVHSECSPVHPCEGLSKHAHFQNFGMAFLTLFRIATGDNWNGIMKASAHLSYLSFSPLSVPSLSIS